MYITYAEVIERYPLLKTLAGNSPMLNNEITYSEYELNSKFATHFTVPFSGAHPTIKDIAIDLVYYRSIRFKDPDQAEKVQKYVTGRIDEIKNGNEYIYTDSYTTIEPDSNKGREIWSNLEDYHPTFSMLDPEHPYSQVDSARLEAEETERE